MNNLQAIEIQEVEEWEVVEKEGFKITDLERANWAFRKIAAYQEKINEVNQVADQDIERINKWREKENKENKGSIEFFEGLIKGYFLELRAADKKAKLSTPFGKVATRKSKKWVFDDKKVINYLFENGYDEHVKANPTYNKAEFKKIFKDGVDQSTGEIVAGVVIKEEEDISIKLD